MRTPDQDRAYDINELETFQETGTKTIETARKVSEQLEESLVRTRRILADIPSRAKLYETAGTVDGMAGRLIKSEYETCLTFIRNNLPRLLAEVPAIDAKYADELETVTQETRKLSGLIQSLKEELAVAAEALPGSPLFAVMDKTGAVWQEIEQQLAELRQFMTRFAKGGQKEGQVCEHDPINMQTGNFIYDRVDLELKGQPVLRMKRSYNVQDERSGSLGTGWIHPYEVRLLFGQEGIITLLKEDGCEEDFHLQDSGEYLCKPSRATLRRMEDEGFCYEYRDRSYYKFNKEGKCLEQGNAEQVFLVYEYDEKGQLAAVNRADGQSLSFTYDTDGRLVTVMDSEQRSITYTYKDGRLLYASTLTGAKVCYTYDEQGKVNRVVNPRKITGVENRYDKKGRILSQKYPDGGTVSFTYNEQERSVTSIEPNGNTVTYYHDEQYRNIRMVYEDGEERVTYNARGQTTSMTNARSFTTHYDYDDRYRLTEVKDASGNHLKLTYDEGYLPVGIALNGTTVSQAVYDGQGNLLKSSDALNRTKTYTYNEQKQISKVTQADGSSIDITYDSRGNIAAITNPFGAVIRYEYNSQNLVSKSVDGNGNQTAYEYDQGDRITKVTNSMGNCRSYTYNESGKVTGVRNFDGSQITCGYGALNKPEWITDQDGNTIRFVYDRSWKLKERVDALGGVTRFGYDHRKRLTKVTSPLGGVTRFSYDACGNRAAVKDAAGKETRFVYDVLNRVIKVTENGSKCTQYRYDAMGNVVSITDPAGRVTRYEYDQTGQRVRQTDVNGIDTFYFYDLLGKLERAENKIQGTVVYEYELGGRFKAANYADGTSIAYQYDGVGNVIWEKGRDGQISRYTYDCLNQMIARIDEAGNQTSFSYDVLGRMTGITDVMGNVTRYGYTPAGRLSWVVDAAGNRIDYDYDGNGSLIRKSQHGDNPDTMQQTLYERDPVGNLLSVTDPLGNQERYLYNRAGQLTKKIDGEGSETSYRYGKDNQLEWIAYTDGNQVAYSYDALSRLQEVKDQLGVMKIERDEHGRVSQVTDYLGQSIGYEWGPVGEKKAVLYPGGTKAVYEYDEQYRLKTLKDGENWFSYEYDGFGRLVEKSSSAGRKSSYQYYENGRLKELLHQLNSEVLDRFCYEYDGMGNIVTLEKNRKDSEVENGSWNYGYDSLRRLTQVHHGGELVRNYEYDAFSNRTLEMDLLNEKEISFEYNAGNQLVSCRAGELLAQYEYDRRGNVIRMLEEETGAINYLYNPAGCLSKVTGQDGSQVSYQYDALGHRIGSSEYNAQGELLKELFYTVEPGKDSNNLLERIEKDVAGVTGQHQSYLWDGGLAGISGAGEYLTDHLGSPIWLLGVESQRYGYDEFGRELYSQEKEIQPFTFTGYQKESIGKQLYAQEREYDVSSGRFMGRDKIKGILKAPMTQNPYLYCWGNPMNLVDRNGLYSNGWGVSQSDFNAWAIDKYVEDMQNTWDQWTGEVKEGFYDGVQAVGDGIVAVSEFVGAVVISGVEDSISSEYQLNKAVKTKDPVKIIGEYIDVRIQSNPVNWFYMYLNSDVRDSLNTSLLLNRDYLDNDEWEKALDSQSIYHQKAEGNEGNTKHLHKDGREAIYTEDGYLLIDDHLNGGTYNVIVMNNDNIWTQLLTGFGHGFFDVAPYYLYGDGPDDPTNIFERIIGYYEGDYQAGDKACEFD